MTGHSINAPQNQEFLSAMHTMTSAIDEHTYLRLANGLQRLYNIHNSTIQANTSNNRNSRIHEQRQIFNEENNIAQNISSALVRHYERVNDISGITINAYPVNSDVYPVNSDNVNTAIYIVNSNANNQNNHSMHWIEAALREGVTRA
jgi:hypothetical protein